MWWTVAAWAAIAWISLGAVGWVGAVCQKRNDNWPENICMIPVCLLFGPVTLILLKWGP